MANGTFQQSFIQGVGGSIGSALAGFGQGLEAGSVQAARQAQGATQLSSALVGQGQLDVAKQQLATQREEFEIARRDNATLKLLPMFISLKRQYKKGDLNDDEYAAKRTLLGRIGRNMGLNDDDMSYLGLLVNKPGNEGAMEQIAEVLKSGQRMRNAGVNDLSVRKIEVARVEEIIKNTSKETSLFDEDEQRLAEERLGIMQGGLASTKIGQTALEVGLGPQQLEEIRQDAQKAGIPAFQHDQVIEFIAQQLKALMGSGNVGGLTQQAIRELKVRAIKAFGGIITEDVTSQGAAPTPVRPLLGRVIYGAPGPTIGEAGAAIGGAGRTVGRGVKKLFKQGKNVRKPLGGRGGQPREFR